MHASHIASVIAVGAISLPLVADTASAVAASPWTTPSIGTQLAELKGYDTVAGDNFGSSVAISGTTLVVGSYAHANNAGRVYVFTRTSRAWKQVAELKGYDTVAGDSFGGSVATSGATVVVGAEALDRAYVFTRTPTGWKQTAELKGSHSVGSTLTNTGDEFGTSVAISGTTIVVSAPVHANYAGRAYVFTKTAAGWKQVAELKGANTISGDQFGTAVAISGRTAVVGAYQAAGGAGRAYVFTKTAASWKQVAELKGSDTVSNDDFGASVAVSGTTVVVGALGHAASAGRTYVFTATAAGWEQVADLKGSNTVVNDTFGYSVAISGTTLVVGAAGDVGVAGQAYVFNKSTAGWRQVAELKGSDTVINDVFGSSVATSGTTAFVGAVGHADFAGRVYVFEA